MLLLPIQLSGPAGVPGVGGLQLTGPLPDEPLFDSVHVYFQVAAADRARLRPHRVDGRARRGIVSLT